MASPGNYAARAAEICQNAPNHRLNWVDDPASGSDVRLIPALAGRCATLAKCLDSPSLDPAVASKALDCLAQDKDFALDKNSPAPKACKEAIVANISSSRASVTAAQNACVKKDLECPKFGHNCELAAIASDATLQKYVACFDKPCGAVESCAAALTELDGDCVDDLF